MFVLIIFALVVFILGILFIAYGVYMYSVRNDKEKQQEIKIIHASPLTLRNMIFPVD